MSPLSLITIAAAASIIAAPANFNAQANAAPAPLEKAEEAAKNNARASDTPKAATPDAPKTTDEAAPKPFGQDEEPREASTQAKSAQDMIDAALKKIDPEIKRDGNAWRVEIGGSFAMVLTDPIAERMRIMVPIAEAKQLDQERLVRLMQANFDTALDARYAISRGVLWATFIHPLTSLTEKDFLSGLIQSITAASNFGTSYSSGVIIFGGGDSRSIQEEELFKRLEELQEEEARNTV